MKRFKCPINQIGLPIPLRIWQALIIKVRVVNEDQGQINRKLQEIDISRSSLIEESFLVFSKLRAYGSHSVLFLNIKSYAGGTRPWNRKNGNQDINDGLIEVVAIDNLDLAILHAGEEANVL
jgi:hypothetical protein